MNPYPPSSSASSSSSSSTPPVTSIASTTNTVSQLVGAVLPQSSISVERSLMTHLSAHTSSFSSSFSQPILHPHARFLNRTEENCPSHLTGKQRTNWIKAGRKAQANQQILAAVPRFSWPQHHYDNPVFLNRLIDQETLNNLIKNLSDVHLFIIDTESTISRSMQSETVPSLIQIQAIFNIHHSIILLLEVQHLPQPNTIEYSLIQRLCQIIFSHSNQIIAWGDPITELHSFERFHLFDCSNVRQAVNLQTRFAQYWNSQHPHESSCPMSSSNDYHFHTDDELICLVESNDLNMDYSPPSYEPDSHQCTCPSTLRPYKSNIPLWSLQKAILYTFNQALDKELTMSDWSCGLDINLHPFASDRDRTVKAAMLDYAMNDVIAVFRLFAHMYPSQVPSSSTAVSTEPIRSNSTNSSNQLTSSLHPHNAETTLHNFSTSKHLVYLLTDSHGRYLNQHLSVINYDVQVNAISGLRFVDQHSPNLCASTILQSPDTSSMLSMANFVIFLIGTNSARCIPFTDMLQQVTDIVLSLRERYPHFSSTHSITFILTFPCYKPSNAFPTTSSLLHNISRFNEELCSLSSSLNFSILDLQVEPDLLSSDRLHLHPRHQRLIATLLSQYIDRLSIVPPTSSQATITTTADSVPILDEPIPSPILEEAIPSPISSTSSEDEHPPTVPTSTSRQFRRNPASKSRRNRLRHDKRHLRRLQNILSRPVCSSWSLKTLKQYLRSNNIRFAFLAPIRQHTLRISFNDGVDLAIADNAIPVDFFDIHHYNTWSSQHPPPQP